MKFLKFLGIMILVAIAGAILLFICYNIGIGAVNKKSTDPVRVVVEDGMVSSDIFTVLRKNGLLKSELAAKIYMKTHSMGTLKAGNYDMSKSENLETMLKKIEAGQVAEDDVKLTFIEGKNIKWLAEKIAEITNNSANDVYKLMEDEEYIDSVIDKYWFITDDIKNEDIYYPLEGYLFPDTYTFETKDVTVKEIFDTILAYTEKSMDKFKEEVEDRNLNMHEVLTLASMAELEGNSYDDRAEIVGVFVNRINKKMLLGSDVTTYYASQVDMGDRDLKKKELKEENPYNTRGPGMAGKLPVGPICNPSADAIDATIHYKETDALYFVADKNGKVYFTNSNAEHERKINELKKEGLWFTYDS